jgi:RNA polymerase sigma factor (sigma-70 family)
MSAEWHAMGFLYKGAAMSSETKKTRPVGRFFDTNGKFRSSLENQAMVSAYAGTLLSESPSLLGTGLSREISDQQLLERFIAEQDESAFVELVQRYGKSVWGVCRRVLQQEQDAEDAFQAVFVVLARKATSIRKGEAVGSWLYGVAYRTAMNARQIASRRRHHEMQTPSAKPASSALNEAVFQEMQRVLDAEVQRLAEKHRAPFVLCCLEGMSKAEAAKELGWKEGTVSSRLAQARKLLQSRLARRGVSLTAVLTAIAVVQNTASAAVPAVLVHAAGGALAPQVGTAAATLSPSAVALAEGIISTMAVAKVKASIAVFVALAMLVGGASMAAVYVGSGTEQDPAKKDLPKAMAAVQADDDKIVAGDFETFVPPPVPVVQTIDARVVALAFAPVDNRLVTAGGGPQKPGQLKIWDAETAKELSAIRGISGVRSLAFSPDGESLATGDFSGFVRVRDARSGAERAAVKGNRFGVTVVAYSKDGKSIASGGLDRIVRIWDAKELKEQRTLIGHAEMINCVAYFRNGKTIVSGSKDKTAIIWNLETGKEKFALRGHLDTVETVAVSPDDQIVATASWDKTIKIWNAETGAVMTTLRGHQAAVLAVAISGSKLASADEKGNVLLWDLATQKVIRNVAKHDGPVWGVAFSHDGKYLASGSSDTTVKLWDLAAARVVQTLVTSELTPVRALAYAPDGDGNVFAIATNDKKPRIHDAKTGAVLHVLPGHQGEVTCLVFSPDGKIVATGSLDETVKLWDRATGKERQTLNGHVGGVSAVAFSPDSKMLASGGRDKTIRVWDTASGDSLFEFKGHAAAVRALAFAPHGALTLASGADDKTIRLWYPNKEQETITLNAHDGPVRALAFGGARLASASDDGTVIIWQSANGKIWRPNPGKEPLVLKGHTGEVTALAFLRGSRTLVSGGQDTLVNIWDPANGLRMGTLRRHLLPVSALAIHRAGTDLLSGGQDGDVFRWHNPKYAPVGGPKGNGPPAAPSSQPGKRDPLGDLYPRNKGSIAAPPLPELPAADGRGGISFGLKPKNYAQEYYHSFKGNPKTPPFDYFGPEGDRFVKFEVPGLHMSLPKGEPAVGSNHGLVANLSITGDFEITLTFELVNEPAPQGTQLGTGISLAVDLDTPEINRATLARVTRWKSKLFTTYVEFTPPGADKPLTPFSSHPTQAAAGRLRIVRNGSQVFFFASEGQSKDFTSLRTGPIHADAVKQVRITGTIGGLEALLDARVIDLHVRADSIVGVPVTKHGPQPLAAIPESPEPLRTGGRGWLVVSVILGAAIPLILAVFGGLVLYLRKRRGVAQSAAPCSIKNHQAALSIGIACPGCGKKLKVKVELAGKKVKCPHCGQAVLIPVATAFSAHSIPAKEKPGPRPRR